MGCKLVFHRGQAYSDCPHCAAFNPQFIHHSHNGRAIWCERGLTPVEGRPLLPDEKRKVDRYFAELERQDEERLQELMEASA